VYRRTVQVPGMLVLISVLVGATLGGIIGALLAIPAAAAIQIVARDVWQERKSEVSHAPASGVDRADGLCAQGVDSPVTRSPAPAARRAGS
jgi:predicted PurR-regulated permease PerM